MAPPNDWKTVFNDLNDYVARYEDLAQRTQAELLDDLRGSGLEITRGKFNQWVTAEIIKPQQAEGKSHPVYDRLEIRKAYLAAYLFEIHDMKPGDIKLVTELYETMFEKERRALLVRDLDEGQRARLILTGRIIGVCGATVLNEFAPPRSTLIICHQQNSSDTATLLPQTKRTFKEVVSLWDPQKNLIGWTGDSQLDEVFSIMEENKKLKQKLVNHEFHTIPIPAKPGASQFAITLGAHPESELSRNFQQIVKSNIHEFYGNNEKIDLINELLIYGLSNITDLENKLRDNLQRISLDADASILNILTTATLLRKPDQWQYAGFYGMGADNTLYLRAASPQYPLATHKISYDLAKDGGPLGWAFANCTPLVINHAYPNDFRLTREIEDINRTHAFIPAIQSDQCAGVLHVIGKKEPNSENICFTSNDIGLLYVLARVIGEAYQRSYIATVTDICRVIPLHTLRQYKRDNLKVTLKEIITQSVILWADGVQLADNYIALFAMRLRDNSPKSHLDAYFELLHQRVNTFFDRFTKDNSRTQQIKIIHDAFRLKPDQIVFIVSNINENEVKDIRQSLQAELDKINDINPFLDTQGAVWSVHLSYEYIAHNFQKEGGSKEEKTAQEEAALRAAEDILSRTESALEVIWEVKAADDALAKRNFKEAVRKLKDAQMVEENNSYILRHLSEAHFGLGQYSEAAEAADKAIKIDDASKIRFASNHLRYAMALFAEEQYDDAFTQFQEACDLSQELKYKRAHIQFLILQGDKARLTEALRMVIRTSSLLGNDEDPNGAWLEYLRGEILLRQGQAQEALDYFEKAASWGTPDQDTIWNILQIRFDKQQKSQR